MDSNFFNFKKIWYITGVSTGVGLCLCQELLKNGDKVVGTSRGTIFSPTISNHPNFLGIQVDITNSQSVQNSIYKTIEHFGGLTHVINNAGYGKIGTIEEVSDEESRKLMDVLYFGPLNILRSVLPIFRNQKNGYIFNVCSIAGFKPPSRLGNYSSCKAALSAVTEALAIDVKPFNIKVSSIVLGFIVTDFHVNNSFSQNQLPEYESSKYWTDLCAEVSNNLLPGDPRKVALKIIENGDKVTLPFNIFIGPIDTFTMADSKISELNQQIESQRNVYSNVVLEK
ncbi:hypothetical protein RB653_006034 [Dictyostelium firmibasis]|uniref:Uncharacterized protein n=1 Tax=Dictyostelium firmibasis TaxID=79012 RepID=A0AAN7U8B1_9MYCE